MKGKRILVTGGLGFIGSNLVPELRKKGHQVWVCDLGHSGEPNYIRCNVSKYRQVEQIFEEHDFDYVYHLAAEYGRWNGEDFYENLWLTNVVGTKNVIRLQEKKKFRMIFFSSAEVHGDYRGEIKEEIMDRVPVKQMNDYAMTKWVGFNQARIRYARDKRYAGQRKYSLWQSSKLAFDGITSFSRLPLRLAIYLGLVVSLADFLYGAIIIILALVFDRIVPGWTTLMATVVFLGGVQLIVVGVIGAYIGRIYVEIQQRPLYLIEQKIGFSKEAEGRDSEERREAWKNKN